MKKIFVVLLAIMILGLTACGKTEGAKTTNDGPITSEVKNESLSNYTADSNEQTDPELPPEEAHQATSSGQNLADLWWEAYQAGTDDEKTYVTVAPDSVPFKPSVIFNDYIKDGVFDFEQFLLDNDFYVSSEYRTGYFRYDAENYFILCSLGGTDECFIDYYYPNGEKSIAYRLSCTFLPQDAPREPVVYETISGSTAKIEDCLIDIICSVIINSKTSQDPLGDYKIPMILYLFPENCLEHGSDNAVDIERIGFYFQQAPGETPDGSYQMLMPNWYLQK